MIRKILMLALATGAANKLYKQYRARQVAGGSHMGNNPAAGLSAGGRDAVSPQAGPGPMQ
jgi:hypothetical protein